jgi:hypothetical protein
MATVIKPKKSETASSVPGTSDLAIGEMAVNTADQKVYVRNAGGTVVEVANGAAGITEAVATAKAIVMAVALG